ncbi:MAG: hypothetical protein KME26_20010 [Oscillatoria princeps RMCB-10]|nr:hypothetical protein [Oscillatoria princeps RMCB-10]
MAFCYARLSKFFINSFSFCHSLYLTDFHRVGNPQLRSRKDWRALRVPAPPQCYSSAGGRQCLSASERQIDRLVCRLSARTPEEMASVESATAQSADGGRRCGWHHPPTRDITPGCI